MPHLTNKKLLRAGLAALVFSLFVIGVQAQDQPTTATQNISPQKQALIRELLELTSSKKTIDAMFKAQADQLDKSLPETIWLTVSGMKELRSLPPEEREKIRLQVISSSARSGRRVYELIQERIDFSKLIEDIFLPLHDKYFTESELRDLIAFYKSPTGIKIIEVMPNLIATGMKQTIDAILPKIMEIVTQVQDEETARVEKEIQVAVKTQPGKPATATPRKRRRP